MSAPLTPFVSAGSIPRNPARFVQVPFAILTDDRLSSGAKLFLSNLLRWDWGAGCWLTDKQLAHELNVTERTVRNHTKALEEAGHLWVFEDREGMTVRLVVRPGHVYPKPPGLGRPASWKKFSKPGAPYMVNRIEVHELPTTALEVDPSSVSPDQETEGPVVSVGEPIIAKELPFVVSEDQEPAELLGQSVTVPLEPETSAQEERPAPSTWTPSEAETQELHIQAETPNVRTLADELTDIGMSRFVADDLVQKVLPDQVHAAIRYVSGYRGEVLNPPGLVRHLLETAVKLPNWCYRPKIDERKWPIEARSQPDPDFDPASTLERELRRAASPHAELWARVCARLETKMMRQSYKTWFVPTFISDITDETVTLNVPSEFFAGWIEEHYLDVIGEALAEEGVEVKRVEVEV